MATLHLTRGRWSTKSIKHVAAALAGTSFIIGSQLATIGLAHATSLTSPTVTAGTATIDEYPTTMGSANFSITTGSDGNVWFTENTGEGSVNGIGKVTPSGTVTEDTSSLISNAGARNITTGPDGNLWFAEADQGNIAKYTTSGVLTEYNVPTSSHLRGLTPGSDGNVWFADGSNVGKITTSGISTEYAVPGGGSVWGMTLGADGNVWFADQSNSQVGKVTPSGTITLYPIPAGSTRFITTGPDGNVWFATWNSGYYGKITPAGVVTEYQLDSNYYGISGITNGPDGNLWITFYDNNTGHSLIGKMSPADGTITAYTVLTINGEPYGITTGADGNIWFTEYNNQVSQIGKLVLTTGANYTTTATSPVTGKSVQLVTSGGLYNGPVTVTAESANARQEASYDYPAGLASFTVHTVPGATATVKLDFTGLAYSPNFVLRKYNATTQTYSTVSGATFKSVTLSGQSSTEVSYTITDGGSLDQDGMVNGVIVDPVGPATATTTTSSSVIAPNTGLPQQPMAAFIVALIAGTIAVTYGIRTRRQKEA